MSKSSKNVPAACMFTVVALAVFVWLAPNAGAQGELAYDIISFRVPGVALIAGSGDMNGDGRIDFLLFHKPSKESRDKFCSIYLQTNGIFQDKPDFEVHLGEQISGIDIDDIDSDGKDELVGFSGHGVTSFKLTGASTVLSQKILSYKTLLPISSRQATPVNWISDLTGDGRKDVLIPVTDGFQLFAQIEDFAFVEARMFDLHINGSFRSEGDQRYISYRIPTTVFSDFDGDGRTDLGAFDLERMDFFLSDNSHSLPRHESAPLLREFSKDFVAASSFLDLNEDGIPDAVLVLMSQKKNLESEVQIYFGRKGFSYPEEPDQVYSADGSLVFPVFLDATGDGKLEMVLHDVNVGVGFFINYFLRNRIRVDTALRSIGPDGRYEDKPAVRRALYIETSESGVDPARAAGDFNGDGLDDLVVGSAENRLSFYLANSNDILPRDPAATFDVPAYGNMSLLTLNDDDRDDMVILYPQEDKQDLAVLLLSK